MIRKYRTMTRALVALLFAAPSLGAVGQRNATGEPAAVTAKLSEWKVELSQATVAAGAVSLTVTKKNRRAFEWYQRLGFRVKKEFGAYVWQRS